MSMTCATRITTNNCQKKTKNVMKKILLSLSLLFTAALAPVGAVTKKKALPPMKEFVGQLMSRMTLQENIDV